MSDTDGAVGQVVGTEDATPLQFNVALREGAYLQLDDVVVTIREVPGVGPVMTSGVVTQVRARHEGASFGSDVFLISDGVLPAQVQEIAEVSTTRVEPEIYVPPRPGRGRPPRPGNRTRSGPVLRPDGRQGAGRPGPGRRPDLHQPGLPGRDPRRARVDQRDLGRGHQDQLRAVPAALDLPVGRARPPGGQRQGRSCSA